MITVTATRKLYSQKLKIDDGPKNSKLTGKSAKLLPLRKNNHNHQAV